MTSAEATVGEHNIYNEYFNAAEQATETVAAIIGMFCVHKNVRDYCENSKQMKRLFKILIPLNIR